MTESPSPLMEFGKSDVAKEPSILENLTVVVPIGEGDESWRTLLGDLKGLPVAVQILLVGTSPQPDDLDDCLQRLELNCTTQWLCAPRGRARQMNHGACQAAHEFLWFLHADSRLTSQSLAALAEALEQNPEALYHFDLKFLTDGPRWASLNARGANLRSRIGGLPFGDQGLCLHRDVFGRLGGFDEQVSYGEDHLLVWKARALRVPLRRVSASIQTSARKYAQHGWARITLLHLWLTAKQALPQALRLWHGRFRRQSGSPGNEVEPRDPITTGRRPRLLVFTKCPDPGRCKTRLIPSLGADGATAVHQKLVEHTLRWASHLAQSDQIELRVHFAGQDVGRLRALCGATPLNVVLRRQVDGDLGDRLSAAFADAFREGSPKVIAIGTDCPSLDAELITKARELLDESDVVIGPAADGGYYLIALRHPVPALFENIPWSQSTVLEATLQRVSAAGLNLAMLPTLQDIDDADDLPEMKRRIGVPDSLSLVSARYEAEVS